MRRCSTLYGPQIGVNCARKHIGWYTKGLHGSAEFRNAFNQEARSEARQGDAARFLCALAEQGGRLRRSGPPLRRAALNHCVLYATLLC